MRPLRPMPGALVEPVSGRLFRTRVTATHCRHYLHATASTLVVRVFTPVQLRASASMLGVSETDDPSSMAGGIEHNVQKPQCGHADIPLCFPLDEVNIRVVQGQWPDL